MECVLYFNRSDKKVVNKTLERVSTIQIEFKEETDIVNPTLILSAGSNVIKANYLYIPSLKRYYYIQAFRTEHQRVIVDAHVDVLMSYKSQIGTIVAIIDRQENKYNLYLEDEEFQLTNKTATRTVQFPNGFNNMQLVLGVVGKATPTNSEEVSE